MAGVRRIERYARVCAQDVDVDSTATLDAHPIPSITINSVTITIYYTLGYSLSNFCFIGDATNSNIYGISKDLVNNNGVPITVVRRTSHIDHGSLHRKACKRLIIKVKKDIANAQQTNPSFMIRWRNDKGPWVPFQTIMLNDGSDNFDTVTLTGMGSYRTRQYEIVHQDNTDFIFVEMEDDSEVLLA